MKKSDTNEKDNAETLKEKLEAIIEHSRAENEALKKILKGLEKINNKQSGKNNKS